MVFSVSQISWEFCTWILIFFFMFNIFFEWGTRCFHLSSHLSSFFFHVLLRLTCGLLFDFLQFCLMGFCFEWFYFLVALCFRAVIVFIVSFHCLCFHRPRYGICFIFSELLNIESQSSEVLVLGFSYVTFLRTYCSEITGFWVESYCLGDYWLYVCAGV